MYVEHDLTIDDAVAFQPCQLAHELKPSRPSWTTWLMIAFFGFMALLASPLMPWGDWNYFSVLALFLFLALLFFALFQRKLLAVVLLRKLRQTLQQKGYAKLLGSRRLEITQDGLTITTATASTTTKWCDVQRIFATKEHAFLYFTPTNGYILPKRAFVSERAFWEFVAKARRFRDEDQIGLDRLNGTHVPERQDQSTGIKPDDGAAF